MSQPGESVSGPERQSLPQNVVRTMQEWQTLHERITLHRRAGLLQAADCELFARLVRDPQIERHLHKVVDTASQDPTLAIITPALGEAEELARVLERAGYPALRTRSAQDVLSPSLLLDERKLTASGIPVEFNVALPSVYLLKEIEPFSSSDERGSLHLTPTSIQSAVEQGIPIQDILDRLHALHRGPLPRAIERQIRAWGHYYGDAAVEQMTLIQVRDAKTLNELLDEPGIQALLRPFVPDPRYALALVASEHLDELLEVLARYGIQVRDRLDQASLQKQE
jgi:hypothetical protein